MHGLSRSSLGQQWVDGMAWEPLVGWKGFSRTCYGYIVIFSPKLLRAK